MTLLLEDAAIAEEYVRTLTNEIPEKELEQIEKGIHWCRTEAMLRGAREALHAGKLPVAMSYWVRGVVKDFPASLSRADTLHLLKRIGVSSLRYLRPVKHLAMTIRNG